METRIDNIYNKLEAQDKERKKLKQKIDTINRKVDKLNNGGLSKAINEQNKMLLNEIFNKNSIKDDFLKMKYKQEGGSATRQAIREWGGWIVSLIVAIFGILVYFI